MGSRYRLFCDKLGFLSGAVVDATDENAEELHALAARGQAVCANGETLNEIKPEADPESSSESGEATGGVVPNPEPPASP